MILLLTHQIPIERHPNPKNTVEACNRGFNASVRIKRLNMTHLINESLVSEETGKYNIL